MSNPPLTKQHGNALYLTPAGKALMAKRIAELCALQTPGNDLTEILNREMGLNRTIQDYWQYVVYRLGLDWTPAKRHPPEVPLAELPICSHCGEVRMPVRYSLANKGGLLLLCENRCCPDCGGKLELHRVLDKARGKPHSAYWAHALPLLPRTCLNPRCPRSGEPFTPTHIKAPHQPTCSRACRQIVASRNWEKKHPEEARKLQEKSAARRREREARGWRPNDWDDWDAEQKAVGIILIENPSIKPRALCILLDQSRLSCIWQQNGGSWERNFAKAGTGRNWLRRLIERLEGNPLLTK